MSPLGSSNSVEPIQFTDAGILDSDPELNPGNLMMLLSRIHIQHILESIRACFLFSFSCIANLVLIYVFLFTLNTDDTHFDVC
jgi:hypothetical protein